MQDPTIQREILRTHVNSRSHYIKRTTADTHQFKIPLYKETYCGHTSIQDPTIQRPTADTRQFKIPLYKDLLRTHVNSRSHYTKRTTADTRQFKIPLYKETYCGHTSIPDPTIQRKYCGQRPFSHQGPETWNNLLFSIIHSHPSFKSKLKTLSFSKTFQLISSRFKFLVQGFQ